MEIEEIVLTQEDFARIWEYLAHHPLPDGQQIHTHFFNVAVQYEMCRRGGVGQDLAEKPYKVRLAR